MQENSTLSRCIPAIRRRLDLLVLAALAFGLYANAISGEFIWDDAGLATSYATWTQPFARYLLSPMIYRPISGFTFYLDHAHFGDAPAGYHVTNILIHIAATLMLYALVLKLTSRRAIALPVAVLFAVIPSHVVAVAWISGRTDSLCAMFFFGALFAHVHYRKTGRRLWLISAAAALLAAVMSKESAAVFPIVILAYEWLYGNLRKRQISVYLAAYAASLGIYGAARLIVIRPWRWKPGMMEAFYEPAPMLERALGFPVNFARYFQMVVTPHDPIPMYSASTSNTLFRGDVLLGVALIAVLTWAFFRLRSRRPEMSLGLAIFALTIAPLCNLFQLPGITMMEQRTYLPSAGLMLVIGSLFEAALRWRPRGFLVKQMIITGIFAALFCAYGYYTVRGNRTWISEPDFWRRVIATRPDSAIAHNNLGRALNQRGLTDVAEEEFRKAAELDPDYPAPHSNLGIIYLDRYMESSDPKDLAEAVRELKTCIRFAPMDVTAMNNLAAGLGLQKKFEESERLLKRVLKLKPNYIDALRNLGSTYQQTGRYGEAARQYEKVLQMQPNLAAVKLELARCYAKSGRMREARRAFSELATDSTDISIQIAAQEELEKLGGA